ncbi:MAG: rRNA maturation RNAse YbeY, partial [Terriglobia bacterium]
QEEQSLEVEIQQLILHGLLHLLGYDHETDEGEMNCLEIRLRRRLNIEGEKSAEAKRLVSRCGMQKKSVH